MSPNLLTTLAWLPPPPRDFNERVRRLREHQGDASAGIQELAACRLDENQTRRLARAIAALRSGPHGLARLVPFRLGLLGNGTLDLVEPALTVAAARYGIALELVRGGYDQIVQEALDPNSAINQAQPDAVLLAIDDRGLKLTASPGDSAAAEESVDTALSLVSLLRR